MSSLAGYADASTSPQSNVQQVSIGQRLKISSISCLTASGLSFASGCSKVQLFVLGISMIPSIIAWLTCTPFGPNSLASDCANALRANLPAANAAQLADPLRLAVAPCVTCQPCAPKVLCLGTRSSVVPVKIRVGGCSKCVDFRSKGRVTLEKLNAPLLFA